MTIKFRKISNIGKKIEESFTFPEHILNTEEIIKRYKSDGWSIIRQSSQKVALFYFKKNIKIIV